MGRNHFTGKVEELCHHLSQLVSACNQSLQLASQRQHVPAGNLPIVVYSFSAFANTVQTLKDASGTITAQALLWSRIEQLRHGAFMRDARNAATHDGHPVVNAWVDGRYFVASNILRLDHRGALIEIPAPSTDVRTLSLEFSRDFSRPLSELLTSRRGEPELQGHMFDISEIDQALTETLGVPEEIKQLFRMKRDEIAACLRNIAHDPVAEAIETLDEVVCYGDERLAA